MVHPKIKIRAVSKADMQAERGLKVVSEERTLLPLLRGSPDHFGGVGSSPLLFSNRRSDP